jgi:CRP-like cAMP-binding protein
MLSDLSIQSLRDRVLLLHSLPAFAPLEDDTLTLLAEHVRMKHCRAGETLLQLGEPIHHVYILLEGEVRWQRAAQAVPSLATAQNVVGWITLMARDPQGMSATVESDAQLIELPAEMLEHAIEQDFSLARNMLRMGADSLVRVRGNLPARVDQIAEVQMGEPRKQRRTLVERLIDMRKAPLFANCDIEALVALTRRTRELRAEPGELLWRAGEVAAPFWLFVDYGKVRCTNAAGESMQVGSGWVIGMMDAIAQRPRAYEARAETQVVGERIELEAFLGVLETHVELTRDFIAFLAQRVLDQG